MLSAVALISLAAAIVPAAAETVHGVVVFSRHGDRSSKHFPGYDLTSLGYQQNHRVGSGYRETYLSSKSPKRILGISENKYVNSQIYASAPDQTILLHTATSFLQGLYPPLEGTDPSIATSTINNGTTVANPLNGYQYVILHGEDSNSPDTIWIKGDDGCPVAAEAGEVYPQSPEYKAMVESTKGFYAGFWDVLKNVSDYTQQNLSYAKAYDIFDLINTGMIHNASMRNAVSESQLHQLRTLADQHEFNSNFNPAQPNLSIGGKTLLGAITNQLNQTVTSKGKLKFSLLAGSYDTFLSIFGLTDLTAVSPNFKGLPDYASTMAFELYTTDNMIAFPTDTSSLNVRFLFRNGTEISPLTEFPLFGRQPGTALSWEDFTTEMKSRSISSVKQWCSTCNSAEPFCLQYISDSKSSAGGSGTDSGKEGGMSNAVAGVIGAMVTLGVLAVAGLALSLVRRRRNAGAQTAASNMERAEKRGTSGSFSS